MTRKAQSGVLRREMHRPGSTRGSSLFFPSPTTNLVCNHYLPDLTVLHRPLVLGIPFVTTLAL